MSIEQMKESVIRWLDELDERKISIVFYFVKALRG